jgi:hypothetical protein
MHAQSVWVGRGAVVGAIQAHRQAAQHGQPHAQQRLQIGGEGGHSGWVVNSSMLVRLSIRRSPYGLANRAPLSRRKVPD